MTRFAASRDVHDALQGVRALLGADVAGIAVLPAEGGPAQLLYSVAREDGTSSRATSLPVADAGLAARLARGELVVLEPRPGAEPVGQGESRVAVLAPLNRQRTGADAVPVATILWVEGLPAAQAGALADNRLLERLGDLVAGARDVAMPGPHSWEPVAQRASEVARRTLVAEGLREILVMLNSDRTLESILGYLAVQARLLLEADACVLYRLDQEQQSVCVEAQAGLPDPALEETEFALGGDGSLGDAALDALVLSESPVSRSDLPDPALGAALKAPAIPEPVRAWFAALVGVYRSALSVPLVVKETYYGSMGLYYTSRRAFSEEDVALAASVGTQAALAIENARLRLHVEQVAVLQERSRLARDLHDSVTQSLYSLTLLAEAARRLAASGELPQVQSAITRLGEIGQQALKEMRLLVYELRPSVLRREGLVRALNQRLETVERRAGVEATLAAEGWLNLPPVVEEQLYHVAQEALNNALKHAAATTVIVRIEVEEGQLHMEIVDNGRGFDAQTSGSEGGIGMESMRERVDRLSGTLSITSAVGRGTRVVVALDLAAVGRGLTGQARQRDG